MDWKDIQSILRNEGFNPGVIDGVPGRMTIGAVKSFQKANFLEPDGIVGPKTLAALRAKSPSTPAGQTVPPWYAIALQKKGLHEVQDHGILSRFLRSDGRTLGDPSKLPWCGDFVETCIALALPQESLPRNPYLARNWLSFGKKSGPALGAVAVFWRGSRNGTSGHVGFYAGEDATHIHVLGGNQSNRVSIARISKSRLLGYRIPTSAALTNTGSVTRAAVGEVTTNEA